MITFVFVYSKDGKIKVLGIEQSQKQHQDLILHGWEHRQTLDACAYIEYLHSRALTCDGSNKEFFSSVLVNEIKNLAI